MHLDTYKRIRAAVIERGHQDDIEWSENVVPPQMPINLALEAAFVICNSGMRYTVACGIYKRVRSALLDGKSAGTAFRHPHKVKSIDGIWKDRRRLFDGFMACETVEEKLAWCCGLPHIGNITKYHLAKNLGVDVAKPDRHLQRIADREGLGVQELCEQLARESGDRVATVDVVLWRACAIGLVDSKTGVVLP